MARTLNSSRPTASVGSYTDPPKLRLICRVVSSSAIARASVSDRASRSSLVTTRGVTGSTRCKSLAQARTLAVGAGQAVIDVDPLGLNTQAEQRVALGGQVLLVGGASGVPDKQCAHGAPPGDEARHGRGCEVSGQRQEPIAPATPPLTGCASLRRRTSPGWPTRHRSHVPVEDRSCR